MAATTIVFVVGGAQVRGETADVDVARFEVTELVKGLVQPMEVAVAPDGTVYWIELNGQLKSIVPASRQVSLVGEVTVTTAQENGLIGLALDPQFATNHWVYLQYSPPDFSGQHISRFTIDQGKLDLASERVLLRYEEQRKECCHHAGSLQFGPGGELFISTGDNTHPHGDSEGYAPLDERPDRAPYDGQKSASNTRSYNGKILRIKPTPDGSYEIPPGNLFPPDGSQGCPEIYVMGCRNPWRMTVDPRVGYVYWGEVGPDAGGDGPRGPRGYDEINQARQAGNYGWPYFIANNLPYRDVDFATRAIGELFDPQAPVNHSPNNTGSVKLPPAQPALIYYPGGPSTTFPELGQGGRTACAGPVYYYEPNLASPVKFPAAYDRTLFIYEWSRYWIKAVHLDPSHQVARIEPFLPDQKFVRPIDMCFGPDGNLFLLEYGETWGVNPEARLVRIDYVSGNRAPVVMASAEHNIGREPLTVSLSSAGSYDKDGDQLSYAWHLRLTTDPQAVVRMVSQEPQATITLAEPGVYNAELVVTDAQGASRTATVPILVGNEYPTLRFLEPDPNDFYDPQRPIPFSLYVQDAEDGTNDYDAAEAQGWEPIDADSPTRVSLNVTHTTSPVPPSGADSTDEQGPLGLRLMKRSDCFNCHAVDQKRVGPPLLEIANKYRATPQTLETSIERVMHGSTGVWGKIPMIPHGQHTPDEVREMVRWIYSLEPAGVVRVFGGFVGEIPLVDAGKTPGHYILSASYTDRGREAVPALSTSVELRLRQRLLPAEAADELFGARILEANSAEHGRFVGSIDHGHYLRVNDVPLDHVSTIRFRVASAGAGGSIEVHLDHLSGELLATAPVAVNGHWEQWYDSTVSIAPTRGRHDLFFLFVHPDKKPALMNVDSIWFGP